MYPAFNCAQRLSQHFSDLMVLKAIKIQQERVPENFRQVVDGGLDIFDAQVAFSGVGYRGLVVVQQEIIRRTVENSILFRLPAVVVDEDVPVPG